MKITDKHVFFWRCTDSVLSNWHSTPGIQYDGKIFKTSEHLFMWLKAIFFGDLETAQEILEASTPRKAKLLGREVQGFSEEAWVEEREHAMITALYNRALCDQEFKDTLLKEEWADKEFVEASPLDKIWGCGLDQDHKDIDNEELWPGINLLGKCLGEVRKML